VSEPEGGSPAAGCAVVGVLGAAALGLLFTAAPVVGILLVWSAGALALWWSVSRPNKIDNPSPPPPGEVSVNEELQVTSLGNGAGYIVYPAGERVHVTRGKGTT
jgi:amino acid transporter